MDGITLNDGTPLMDLEQQCRPAIRLGYQMVHNITGRLLPTTTRNQIYTAWAATEKMGEVGVNVPTLELLDYVMKPVFDCDVDVHQCTLIGSLFD